MEKKVFIVDDHEIFRTGLMLVMRDIEQVRVVGEAVNGMELLRYLEKRTGEMPDIVFMDIDMPVMNGILATEELKTRFPQIKVIALTMFDDEEYLDQMLTAGAKGFLLKKVNRRDLENALDYVSEGKSYISSELVSLMADRYVRRNDKMDEESVAITQRELEVIELVAEGYSNAEIADKLFVSQRTIEKRRANLIEKTNVRNSIGLVVYAIKNKLIKV